MIFSSPFIKSYRLKHYGIFLVFILSLSLDSQLLLLGRNNFFSTQAYAEDEELLEDDESFEDDPFEDEYQAKKADPTTWDPLEPINRKIFWFNDALDRNIVEPWARYYDRVTPEPAQKAVRDFFINLQYPRYLVSDILTLNFKGAWVHTARFALNSTVGFFGIFDVAKEYGFEHKPADMGLTLQRLGVPAGPYIVLPILGPSNLRDTFGTTLDTFLDPLFWASYTDYLEDTERLLALGSLKSWELMQRRVDALEAISAGRRSSVDFYLFAQAAYGQYRSGMLKSEENVKSCQEVD